MRYLMTYIINKFNYEYDWINKFKKKKYNFIAF